MSATTERLHRVPPEYARRRVEIVTRVLAGQSRRDTARQLSEMADDFPQFASSLITEANEWWQKAGPWPKAVCGSHDCRQQHLCGGGVA